MFKLLLGCAFLGLGIYLYKNRELTDRLETKLKDGLNVINENTKDVQEKVKTFVNDTLAETKETMAKSPMAKSSM
jgi:hypothetical protein